jgi:DNA-binding PadR family transcriptional regulator
MFIETQVTLADGRRVKAYYLDEEGLKTIQGIDSRFDYVLDRLNSIQDELIRALFVPLVTERILQALKEKPNQTQREIAEKILPKDFAKNQLIHQAFWDAWKTLEKNSVITPESHGRGHPRTWKIRKVGSLECKV